jgi:hypothetical protein
MFIGFAQLKVRPDCFQAERPFAASSRRSAGTALKLTSCAADCDLWASSPPLRMIASLRNLAVERGFSIAERHFWNDAGFRGDSYDSPPLGAVRKPARRDIWKVARRIAVRGIFRLLPPCCPGWTPHFTEQER